MPTMDVLFQTVYEVSQYVDKSIFEKTEGETSFYHADL